MGMNRFIRLALAALPVLVSADAALAQAGKKIAVGDVAPIAADWPHFVATAKGLYQKEGVAPQVTYVGNVANTVQQLAGGNFDIAVSTFDTAIRAIVKGADAIMIGGGVTKYPYSIMTAKSVTTAVLNRPNLQAMGTGDRCSPVANAIDPGIILSRGARNQLSAARRFLIDRCFSACSSLWASCCWPFFLHYRELGSGSTRRWWT